MKTAAEGDTVSTLLAVVADLLRGDKHSRRTIAESTGKSLPTADRWIDQIEATLPNTRRFREGKTTWLVHDARRVPSLSAATGACVAASLASAFEGSAQERNLKDARDYILKERGETFSDLERKFVLAPRGGEYALPEAGADLDEIVQALLQDARLRFEYQHNDGRHETLTIEPLSLVLFEHRFYVLAPREQGFYPYRFARMGHVQRLEERFEYPAKGAYDPSAVLAQGFGIHTFGTGAVEDVEIVLSEPWASFALGHRWHPTQRAVRHPDGTVSIMLQVRYCRELETWVLGFGEQARVVRPQRLRQEIASRLQRAAGVYQPARTARPSIAKARRQAAEVQAKRRTK